MIGTKIECPYEMDILLPDSVMTVLHGTGNSSDENSDVPQVACAETPAGDGEQGASCQWASLGEHICQRWVLGWKKDDR